MIVTTCIKKSYSSFYQIRQHYKITKFLKCKITMEKVYAVLCQHKVSIFNLFLHIVQSICSSINLVKKTGPSLTYIIQVLINDLKRVYFPCAHSKIQMYITYRVKTTKSSKDTRALRVHQKQRMKNLLDFKFFKNFSNSKP